MLSINEIVLTIFKLFMNLPPPALLSYKKIKAYLTFLFFNIIYFYMLETGRVNKLENWSNFFCHKQPFLYLQLHPINIL